MTKLYDVSVLFPVDADEIRRLSKSFKKLDLNQNGALDVDEFLQIPELQQNPLVRRVIEIFDEDGNGEVDFKGSTSHARPMFVEEFTLQQLNLIYV